jgi:hypothetical protein
MCRRGSRSAESHSDTQEQKTRSSTGTRTVGLLCIVYNVAIWKQAYLVGSEFLAVLFELAIERGFADSEQSGCSQLVSVGFT